MRQCWGLPHRLAQCMSPQGWGKLVNAVLLSLINEACLNVCCGTLFSSELVSPTCVQAWSSNPRGRACKPNGAGSGEEGYWVTLYLFIYTVRLFGIRGHCFSRYLIQACMPAGRPATWNTSHLQPRPNLVEISRTIGSLPTRNTAPSVIAV